MSRQRRVCAAAAILALGTAAAWPFRLEKSVIPATSRTSRPAPGVAAAPPIFAPPLDKGSGVAATAIATTAEAASLPSAGVALPSRRAEALFSADAVADRDAPGESPVTPVDALDADSSSAGMAGAPLTRAATRTYVIHNGDSLERIAARYLGDEGRALEIFDLNREVLANPYLLPLGAELTLPAR